MAENAPEKPEVAATVASTEDKVAERDVAAKTVDKSEADDATMEEAKEAEGELPPTRVQQAFRARSKLLFLLVFNSAILNNNKASNCFPLFIYPFFF